MEKQLIISVGREFGSGGHEVAQKLADDYGIALYDHDPVSYTHLTLPTKLEV